MNAAAFIRRYRLPRLQRVLLLALATIVSGSLAWGHGAGHKNLKVLAKVSHDDLEDGMADFAKAWAEGAPRLGVSSPSHFAFSNTQTGAPMLGSQLQADDEKLMSEMIDWAPLSIARLIPAPERQAYFLAPDPVVRTFDAQPDLCDLLVQLTGRPSRRLDAPRVSLPPVPLSVQPATVCAGETPVFAPVPLGDLDAALLASTGFGNTGHAEAVQVVYDPKKVSYDKLLEVFWHNVDPTVKDRQFCDVGTQYRTGIFVYSPEQKAAAEKSKELLAMTKPFKDAIVTPVADAGDFWPAEEYHRNYAKQNKAAYDDYRFGCGRDLRLSQVWKRP